MKFYKTIILLFLGSLSIKNSVNAQDIPPTTSLVYPGIDGKLIYVPDSLGNIVPDFSNAGYKGGGVPIPYVQSKVIVWPVLGDNAERIQKAIDSVSTLTPDAYGFRGAVLLRAGFYVLENPIYIRTSGVVLRGEGQGDTGTILYAKIPKPTEGGGRRFRRPAVINIAGEFGITIDENSKQDITDNYVPVGARSFNVKAGKGFKVGDKISIKRIGNEDFIKAIGLDSASVGRNQWRPFDITFDRIITAVNGNRITVDAPIYTAVDSQWGGGNISKYSDARIEQVGIENLRGISEYDPSVRQTAYGNMDRDDLGEDFRYQGEEYYSDENHHSTLVDFSNIQNGWVRNITALHFANSVIQVNAGTKWITIQDCESREPVSQRWGGRRFTFQINGQLSLIQRCLAQKGRHSFVLQGSEASGNVFLECIAINPYSSSEPHNRWSNGVLYDNVKAPLTARFWDYIIGWAGANIVFWNCEGDYLIQSPPTANNYSFGHIGVNAVVFNAALQDLTKPNGHVESMDKHVTPKSLYLTQLKERLGMDAVNNTLIKF